MPKQNFMGHLIPIMCVILFLALVGQAVRYRNFALLFCMGFGVCISGVLFAMALRQVRDDLHKPAPTLYIDTYGICHQSWKPDIDA